MIVIELLKPEKTRSFVERMIRNTERCKLSARSILLCNNKKDRRTLISCPFGSNRFQRQVNRIREDILKEKPLADTFLSKRSLSHA